MMLFLSDDTKLTRTQQGIASVMVIILAVIAVIAAFGFYLSVNKKAFFTDDSKSKSLVGVSPSSSPSQAQQYYRYLGSSMVPTLKDSDCTLLLPVPNELHRGDLVVFTTPALAQKLILKRIIGLPGEKFKLANNQVVIDGNVLQEPYLTAGLLTEEGLQLRKNVETEIPSANYIVLGDNRPFSYDSRDFGFVAKSAITGIPGIKVDPSLCQSALEPR